MAVSARYDVDVHHGVSRAELRKMQADLSRQKVGLSVSFFQLPHILTFEELLPRYLAC